MSADANIKTIAEIYQAFGRGDVADVLTVVRFRARSRGTGRTAQMNLHHYFMFRDGKIAYYRGTEDTAQTQTVLQS
jgi:ketosteroid isomerase-like protein